MLVAERTDDQMKYDTDWVFVNHHNRPIGIDTEARVLKGCVNGKMTRPLRESSYSC